MKLARNSAAAEPQKQSRCGGMLRGKKRGRAKIPSPHTSMRKLNKVLLCGMVKVEDAECLPSTCRI